MALTQARTRLGRQGTLGSSGLKFTYGCQGFGHFRRFDKPVAAFKQRTWGGRAERDMLAFRKSVVWICPFAVGDHLRYSSEVCSSRARALSAIARSAHSSQLRGLTLGTQAIVPISYVQGISRDILFRPRPPAKPFLWRPVSAKRVSV